MPKKSDMYIVREIKVDEQTVVRKRVKLTPDTCNICGFSVCAANNMPAYDQLDPLSKARVDGTLQSHKQKNHPPSTKRLLREEELPVEWLGADPDAAPPPTVGDKRLRPKPRPANPGDF